MDGAKSNIGSVELPTGVMKDGAVVTQVTFRELAGPEEDILASQSMGNAQKLTEVMANCTQSFGSVTLPGEIKKMVASLVMTDRFYYLVQLRILSLGPNYSFTTRCPSCGADDKVIYDLNDLKVTKAPKANELFHEITFSNGHKLRWKVADGEVDAKIERMANDKNAATIGLFARATECNDKPVVISDVINLSLRDRSAYRDAIAAAEGEFDDKYNATCPKCGHAYEGEIEMEGKSFFSP